MRQVFGHPLCAYSDGDAFHLGKWLQAGGAEKAVIGKVDVDTNPEVSAKFGIRSIPTLLVFKGGEVVGKQIGAVPKNVLAQKLDAQMA